MKAFFGNHHSYQVLLLLSNLTTNHVKTFLGTNLSYFLPSSQKPISQGNTYPHNLGLGPTVWRPSRGLATRERHGFQHMLIDGVKIYLIIFDY